MKKRKSSRWQKIRKFFNEVHLWIGLTSGLILLAVCGSGALYTYHTELIEWSARHLHRINRTPEENKLKIEQLLARVVEETSNEVTRIQIPADPTRTYRFSTRPTDRHNRRGETYFVDPYAGTILGTSEDQAQTRTARWMQTTFSLHRWLLLDRVETPLIGEIPNRKLGSYVTGTATILFTLGVLTGLVVWFPQKLRNWRQGLRIHWRAKWKRVNRDLHNTLAFYASVFLLLMGLTGPQWSFPWYREGLQKVLGTYREAPAPSAPTDERSADETKISSSPIDADYSLPFEELLVRCDEVLPYTGDYTIHLSKNDLLEIQKNRIGFFAPAGADKIKIEAATGTVREVTRFRDKPLNERIAGSIKALHIGNVYGGFSKLLYFLACLIATSLPVTGTLIWLNKIKKKPARRLNPPAQRFKAPTSQRFND